MTEFINVNLPNNQVLEHVTRTIDNGVIIEDTSDGSVIHLAGGGVEKKVSYTFDEEINVKWIKISAHMLTPIPLRIFIRFDNRDKSTKNITKRIIPTGNTVINYECYLGDLYTENDRIIGIDIIREIHNYSITLASFQIAETSIDFEETILFDNFSDAQLNDGTKIYAGTDGNPSHDDYIYIAERTIDNALISTDTNLTCNKNEFDLDYNLTTTSLPEFNDYKTNVHRFTINRNDNTDLETLTMKFESSNSIVEVTKYVASINQFPIDKNVYYRWPTISISGKRWKEHGPTGITLDDNSVLNLQYGDNLAQVFPQTSELKFKFGDNVDYSDTGSILSGNTTLNAYGFNVTNQSVMMSVLNNFQPEMDSIKPVANTTTFTKKSITYGDSNVSHYNEAAIVVNNNIPLQLIDDHRVLINDAQNGVFKFLGDIDNGVFYFYQGDLVNFDGSEVIGQRYYTYNVFTNVLTGPSPNKFSFDNSYISAQSRITTFEYSNGLAVGGFNEGCNGSTIADKILMTGISSAPQLANQTVFTLVFNPDYSDGVDKFLIDHDIYEKGNSNTNGNCVLDLGERPILSYAEIGYNTISINREYRISIQSNIVKFDKITTDSSGNLVYTNIVNYLINHTTRNVNGVQYKQHRVQLTKGGLASDFYIPKGSIPSNYYGDPYTGYSYTNIIAHSGFAGSQSVLYLYSNFTKSYPNKLSTYTDNAMSFTNNGQVSNWRPNTEVFEYDIVKLRAGSSEIEFLGYIVSAATSMGITSISFSKFDSGYENEGNSIRMWDGSTKDSSLLVPGDKILIDGSYHTVRQLFCSKFLSSEILSIDKSVTHTKDENGIYNQKLLIYVSSKD